MAFTSLTSAQCDANSPGDETLFQLIRTNFDDLNSRIGVVTPVSLGSDFTRSAATYADVTAFSFAVASGKSYSFEFQCIVNTAACNPYGISVNGPATSALNFAAWIPYNFRPVATDYCLQDTQAVTAYDTVLSSGVGFNGTCSARVWGTLTTTASGTLILRARSDGVNTLTIKKGSFGVLYQY